jgi:hypothetical protein
VDGLTRRIAVALGTAFLVLGCRERAQAVQGEADLRDMVHRMMPAVAEAARMPFKNEPLVYRRSRDQVRSYVLHKFDEDLPPAELEGVQSALRRFGLIPENLDLRATMIDVLTEQIAGYYDPDSNALYIPGDVQPTTLRIVVSHELVHALQDQYAKLDSIMKQHARNDRRSAAQAVLEGQATIVQLLVLMPEQKPDTFPPGWFWKYRSAMAQQQAQMPQFEHAPLWLKEGLVFPYLGGADFIVWYRRKYFGRSVLDAMPVSTEQILHPERYANHDMPTDLRFGGASPDTVRFEDNLGEFEIRLLFQQHLGDEAAAIRLAEGWDGDRYQVLGPRGEALVWYTVWDDAESAARFAEGLQRAWSKGWLSDHTGRRSDIQQLTVNGRALVRLVDAPGDWKGWAAIPAVQLSERDE